MLPVLETTSRLSLENSFDFHSVIQLFHFRQANVSFLFELIFLLRLFNLVPNSDFAIKFACANLASKTPATIVVNSGALYICYDYDHQFSFQSY